MMRFRAQLRPLATLQFLILPAAASLMVGVGQLRWRLSFDRHHQRMLPEIRGIRSEHWLHVEGYGATISIRPRHDNGTGPPRWRIARPADIDARRRADH